ncbi:MAG: glycine cleavage system protein GcvH [Planctomycetota bacterium]
MGVPTDRKYSESHEWHKVDGDVVTLGITAFAADQLTDVTFAEMKGSGTSIAAGETVGEVESVKTTSDIYSSVAGEIVEVNPELEANPGVINEDPFEKGWLVKIRVSDASGLENLMDAEAYEAHAG